MNHAGVTRGKENGTDLFYSAVFLFYGQAQTAVKARNTEILLRINPPTTPNVHSSYSLYSSHMPRNKKPDDRKDIGLFVAL
jgi:hypothetical protein